MPRSSLPLVAAALQDPDKVCRIRRGADRAQDLGWGRVALRVFQDLSQMDHALGETVPAVLIVEPEIWLPDPVSGDGTVLPGPPSAAQRIIAYLDKGAVPAEMVDVLLRLRISKTLVKERDDQLAAVSHLLVKEAALGSGLGALEGLVGEVPAWFLELLRRALPLVGPDSGNGPAWAALDVAAFAELWMPGASARSLRRALARQGLPRPGWLLRWLVALRAVSLHGQGGVELWRAAHELGFDSAEALSRRIKRLTGRAPRKLSEEDLLELLRDRCRPGESRG